MPPDIIFFVNLDRKRRETVSTNLICSLEAHALSEGGAKPRSLTMAAVSSKTPTQRSSVVWNILLFSFFYKYRSGSLNILQDKKISRGGIVKIDCRLYFQGVAFTLIRFVSHSLAVCSSCHSSSCTNTKDGPSTNLKCIFSFKKTFVRRIYVYKWILFLWSINLIH